MDASYPQLMSLAVHEMRSPASVVAGYLRMLQQDSASLSERQRRMIEEAEKSCGRLTQLIAELSDVGKIDSGAIELARQPVDLFALASRVAASVHEPEERGVRLTMTGGGNAPILGDEPRLTAALQAIFRAVLREQPSASAVAADCRLVEDGPVTSAVIVVSEMSAVARAYAAPRAPFDDSRGGLGLALAIGRRVIERAGGALYSPIMNPGDPIPSRGAALISFPLRRDA